MVSYITPQWLVTVNWAAWEIITFKTLINNPTLLSLKKKKKKKTSEAGFVNSWPELQQLAPANQICNGSSDILHWKDTNFGFFFFYQSIRHQSNAPLFFFVLKHQYVQDTVYEIHKSCDYNTAESDLIKAKHPMIKYVQALYFFEVWNLCVAAMRQNILVGNLQMDPALMPLGTTDAFKQKISDNSQFTN